MSRKSAFLTLTILALALGSSLNAWAQTSPDFPTGGPVKLPEGGGGRARQTSDGTSYTNPFIFLSSFRIEPTGSQLVAPLISGRARLGSFLLSARRRSFR